MTMEQLTVQAALLLQTFDRLGLIESHHAMLYDSDRDVEYFVWVHLL